MRCVAMTAHNHITAMATLQGPEPKQAIGDIMRHNLGCMLHPKTLEDEKEPQQPILVARVTGDDEPKVISEQYICSAAALSMHHSAERGSIWCRMSRASLLSMSADMHSKSDSRAVNAFCAVCITSVNMSMLLKSYHSVSCALLMSTAPGWQAVGVTLEHNSTEGVKLNLEALQDPQSSSAPKPPTVRTSIIEVPHPEGSASSPQGTSRRVRLCKSFIQSLWHC